jgi:outer membrane protein TolC
LFGTAHAQTFTLDQAIDYAMVHNKELLAARESVEAAKGRKTEVFSAVLPKLTLDGGYTYLSQVPQINFSGPKIDLPAGMPEIPQIEVNQQMGNQDNYKAELRLNQLIFASGAAIKAVQASKAGAQASEYRIAAAEDTLASQVAEVFYSVLLTKEILIAKTESLKTSQAHLEDVENRFKFGTASKFELLRSQVEVANLRPEVSKTANAVLLAKNALRTRIGYPLNLPIAISGSLSELSFDFDYQSAINFARENRKEIAALDAGITGQKDATWAATGGMLPKIVAYGSFTYQNPWYFEQDWTDIWSAGVGISIPLFDGLEAIGKRNEAAARARQLQKQKAALLEGIDFSIRQAIIRLEESKQRIVETKANVARAEQANDMAKIAYQNGVATNLEVLDAQLSLTWTRIRHIQALYDFQIAKTQLLAAAGKLRGKRESE